MGDNIESLVKQLISAIEINMNPNVSQQQRGEAYLICEEFKSKSPHCAQCGLHLCRRGHLPVVRHFGLQLLEHCIKFRWNSMRLEEKAFIKNNVLELLANGTDGILNEQSHIKGALARIVVEMIKREWPQQWSSLLEELYILCSMGETQTELVLLIFLGLAEDTVILQTVPPQRRREILKTLNLGLSGIFPFFLETLRKHNHKYQQALKSEDIESQQVHARLVETVLTTLGSGYLEWCPLVHVAIDNHALLPLLCSLLSDDRFRLPAAECLIALLTRKGKTEEGTPYLVLFKEENMEFICSVATSGLSQAIRPPQEALYIFLKRLCLMHTSLGAQLTALWGETDKWKTPPTFLKYVQTLLAYTEHPSKLLSSVTVATWQMFFQHSSISSDEVIQQCMPSLLEACMVKLAKLGYPSRNDSPSCDYSRLDFDSDDDFHNFMSKYRSEVADLVRSITIQNPTLAFGYSARWLQTQMTKPIDAGQGGEHGLCHYNSPSFLEWDALAIFLESVHSKLIQPGDKAKPSAIEGISLLKAILEYHTEDPLVLSSVLSCISGLFVFLSADADCLPTVLKKIFSVVVYTIPGQTKATRPKTVKNVRRHACSSLIKICKQYPGLLLPVFEEIYSHVKQLSVDPDQLSQLEKCTLYEVLVLICNEFHDYERQSSFLKEITTPVHETWLGLGQAFLSAETFMSAIGIDSAPVMPSTDDYRGITRSQILFCLNFLLGVMKRSQWPSDVEVARKSGFIADLHGGGETYRNPIATSALSALEPLFCLIRVLNRVCTPESRSRMHPEFACALGMTDLDRSNVMGSTSPSTDLNSDSAVLKQPWERMQMFFANIFDQCFHILGNAGPSLGAEFYCYPNLSEAILNSVFDHLEFQPDFRLRTVLRVFIKPFIQHCPHHLTETSVVPLLGALCPLMLKKLSEKWKAFNQRYGFSPGYEDEMTENQEILEDKLNRILTREYIDLLATTISSLKRPIVQQNLDSMEEETETVPASSSYDKLSELGLQLLSKESLCSTLVATLFNTLHWDSVASVKSAHLCWPTLKQLVAEDVIQSEQEATYLLQSVLHGLQVFGEHDANRAVLVQLGTQVYEHLRPKFSGLAVLLQQTSGCSFQEVQAFDEKLLNVDKPLTEKRKRDLFKHLITGVIGIHVSAQFKQEIEIRNLAPMTHMFRKRSAEFMDSENKDIGLTGLFNSK